MKTEIHMTNCTALRRKLTEYCEREVRGDVQEGPGEEVIFKLRTQRGREPRGEHSKQTEQQVQEA